MEHTVRIILRKLDKYAVGIMIMMGVVFYFVPGQWICFEDDSWTYLGLKGLEGGLYLLYPLFLGFFRRILGEHYFLNGVVVVQSVLAIICTLLFVNTLRKRFKLQGWECILLYAACMLPFSIYLPEAGITHYILTEGVTYSLFYIYFLFLLNFVLDRRYKWAIGLLIMSLCLMFTRSQLIILLLTTFAAFIYVAIRKIRNRKTVVKVISLSVGLAIAVGWLFVTGLRTQKINLPQFTAILMIKGFYEVDYEDKELFDTPVMQEIFERVYNAVDEKGYRYAYARQDLYMWQDLLCDRIIFVAREEIGQYLSEHPEVKLGTSEIVWELGSTVLFRHFGRYLYHVLRLLMPGFIAAVFFQIQPIYLLCHFIALFIYIYAIVGSIICIRYKRNRCVSEYMLTTVCFILIMIVTVNLVFVGAQRYVVYAMGIFYCAAYLLFKELIMMCLDKIKSRDI